MMLDELHQKEWCFREVFRRDEEVRFFSLPGVFPGEERSTREVRVVRHDEGSVRLLDI